MIKRGGGGGGKPRYFIFNEKLFEKIKLVEILNALKICQYTYDEFVSSHIYIWGNLQKKNFLGVVDLKNFVYIIGQLPKNVGYTYTI